MQRHRRASIDLQAVAAYSGAFGALVAGAAAVAAWRAAKHAKSAVEATLRTAEANLLNGLLAEYHGDDMREALAGIRTFRDQNANDLVGAYRKLHADNRSAWIPVSKARRTVSGYFYRVLALREGRYVTDAFVKLAAVPTGYSLLLEVVEALEYAHADRQISVYPYVRAKFDALIAICGDGGVPRFTLPQSSQAELA